MPNNTKIINFRRIRIPQLQRLSQKIKLYQNSTAQEARYIIICIYAHVQLVKFDFRIISIQHNRRTGGQRLNIANKEIEEK